MKRERGKGSGCCDGIFLLMGDGLLKVGGAVEGWGWGEMGGVGGLRVRIVSLWSAFEAIPGRVLKPKGHEIRRAL